MIQESNGSYRAKVEWSKLSDDDVGSYCERTDALLNSVFLPYDAIMCSDFNCKDKAHHNNICAMYEAIAEYVRLVLVLNMQIRLKGSQVNQAGRDM